MPPESFTRNVEKYMNTAVRAAMFFTGASAIFAAATEAEERWPENGECPTPRADEFVSAGAPCVISSHLTAQEARVETYFMREGDDMATYHEMPSGGPVGRLSGEGDCWTAATSAIAGKQLNPVLDKATHAENCEVLVASVVDGPDGKGRYGMRRATPEDPCRPHEREIAVYSTDDKTSLIFKSSSNLSKKEVKKLRAAGALTDDPRGAYVIDHSKIPDKKLRKKLGECPSQHQHFIFKKPETDTWRQKNGKAPLDDVLSQRVVDYLEANIRVFPEHKPWDVEGLTKQAATEPPPTILAAYMVGMDKHMARAPRYKSCEQSVCFDVKAAHERVLAEFKDKYDADPVAQANAFRERFEASRRRGASGMEL